MLGALPDTIKVPVNGYVFRQMDWTLFPSRALALNLQTIGEKLGERFVYEFGYQAGHDAAREMVKYSPVWD